MQYEFMPFYVGQKVVALKGGKVINKGQIYTVRKCAQYPCGCWVVDIGVSRGNGYSTLCDPHTNNEMSGDYWYAAQLFAPVETRFISLAEVIKIESPLTCVN